jgi:signal transduction histidine kinase/CheY-like chemotaxis protein
MKSARRIANTIFESLYLGSPFARTLCLIAIPIIILSQIIAVAKNKTVQSESRFSQGRELFSQISAALDAESQLVERFSTTLAFRMIGVRKDQDGTLPTADELAAIGIDLVILTDNSGNYVWSLQSDLSLIKNFPPTEIWRNLKTVPLSNSSSSGLLSVDGTPTIASIKPVDYFSPDGIAAGRILVLKALDLQGITKIVGATEITITPQRVVGSSARERIGRYELSTNRSNGGLNDSQLISGLSTDDIFKITFRYENPPISQYQTLFSFLSFITIGSILLTLIASIAIFNRLVLNNVRSIKNQLTLGANQNRTLIVPHREGGEIFDELIGELNTVLSSYHRAQQTAAHATRVAQGAIDARTDYVVSISHEVRSPLNAILGIAQILERMSLPIHLREYVHVLKDSGNTLLDLINDMLDYSSIETGSITFERTPVDIRELLTQVTSSQAHSSFRKNVELVLDISADAPTHIEADRLRLKQILSTLVENAVTTSEAGEIVVTLSAEAMADGEGTRVLFSIKDSGLGIPLHQQSEIFESFNRAETDGFGRMGRTGLSIPIVRGLARAMGGEIWVDSIFGQGATFFFELTTSAISFRKDSLANINPETDIFIVDSSESSGSVLNQILAELGFASRSQITPDLLLQRIKDPVDLPTLIFIDARLLVDPILEKLAQLSSRPNISWYVLLPPITSASADIWIEAGATNIIPKPVSRATFLQYLKQPLLRLDHPSAEEPPQRDTPITRTARGLSVLVVDDIESNRFILSSLLHGWGHTVTTASSGLEAVNIMRDRGHFETNGSDELFDLVFMDIQMPKISGIEATRMIRASEKLSDRAHAVPIIAVTADAQVRDIDEYVCVGMWGAVTKPILALRLFGIIESLGLRELHGNVINGKSQNASFAGAELVAALELRSLNFSVSRLWNDLGYDVAKLREILSSFVIESDLQVAQIAASVAARQFGDTAHLAHALRGAMLNVGALGCAKIVANLETSAKEADVLSVEAHAQKLGDNIKELLKAVSTVLDHPAYQPHNKAPTAPFLQNS